MRWRLAHTSSAPASAPATICLAPHALWPEIFPITIHEYANVQRAVASVLERPALKRVIAHHLPTG